MGRWVGGRYWPSRSLKRGTGETQGGPIHYTLAVSRVRGRILLQSTRERPHHLLELLHIDVHAHSCARAFAFRFGVMLRIAPSVFSMKRYNLWCDPLVSSIGLVFLSMSKNWWRTHPRNRSICNDNRHDRRFEKTNETVSYKLDVQTYHIWANSFLKRPKYSN